ncbi:hypothetical protein RPPS3_26000 [Rhodopseudomonas palustris]|uniref:hypothetical protein n=1 Tax=Rhodopseudomonas palustris TaxID=1076 RepID=UPI000D1A4356|nr:hypothetical protein [Rhodopseudomonas palustris]AVT76663.1 hypothetical protein RPPS3_26000 [Rhodopseudomonas palustris]
MTIVNRSTLAALKAYKAMDDGNAVVNRRALDEAISALENATADPASIKINPMSTAPRDGTLVYIYEENGSNIQSTLARVVPTWVTDEFIPHDISATDTSGMNHGAIPNEFALGWLPA